MNKQLFNVLNNFSPWQEIISASNKNQISAIYDASESQRAFLSAALTQHTKRQVLYIAPTQALASRTAEDAAAFLSGAAAALAVDDPQFIRAVSGREASWQRLSVISRAQSGEIKLLCVSAEALLNKYMPAANYQQSNFVLNVGDE